MAAKKKNSIIEVDDLLSLLKIFSKNWYILLASLLLFGTISYFYTYKLTDIYAAKSQILLKNDETYDYQNQIYKGIGYYQGYQDNSNQIRVLTSTNLIAEAISKLNLDVSYYIVGRLKTTEVYQGVPFEFSVKTINPVLFEREIKFRLLNENQFELEYNKGEQRVKKTFPFDVPIEDQDFFITVKKSDIINKNSIEGLKKTDYFVKIHNAENLVYKIKNNLTVESIESTTILELSLQDEIAARAVTFLDTLSSVYINYTSKSQIIINNNTLDNIDKQLKEITEILTDIEDDMESYKSDKAVLNLTRQEENYFDRLIEFDSEKRQLELWVQSLEALQKYIITVGSLVDEKLLPPSFYIEPGDDYLRTALGKLYSLQMERNQRLNGSTAKNRNISELDDELELLRKNILTYIDNSKTGLRGRISDIKKQIADYTEIIKTVPKTQRDLLNIQRKLDVNEKMYSYLLEKRASTLIARAGILPETSIIETAHSAGIVAPNKRKIMYYFLTVGAVLSLIIIFIRTVLFSTIENIEELKRLTHLPVLGQVLLNKDDSKEYIIVDKDPKSSITESFRGLRTNLEYLASEASSKTVLVTSYNPGEGKTFCSVNLATILAKAGKKVLIVELDLHKPKVQKALDMSSDIGVSTILIGRNKPEEAVMPTHIENLFVILSGPTPPNASEIILSKHLVELFDYGKANFDYVIIDTAPVGLITDALVIMKNVDISLFVINTRFAKKHIVTIVEDIVSTNKIKNFGLILNGVKQSRGRYYYNYGYGYGYGSGYGYGYGYGNKSDKS